MHVMSFISWELQIQICTKSKVNVATAHLTDKNKTNYLLYNNIQKKTQNTKPIG